MMTTWCWHMTGRIKSRLKAAGFILVFTWLLVGLWHPFDWVPSVPEARADTQVQTWVFNSDAEGLADAGITSNVTFDHDSGDSAVKFNSAGKNLNDTEYARRSTTGQNWVTWGVPSGATVTHVQITGWKER